LPYLLIRFHAHNKNKAMKKITTFLTLSGILLMSLLLPNCKQIKEVEPAKQYSVEDFFKKPEKVSFSLSPDGKYYAYRAPYERRMNIFVQEIGTENSIRLTSDTARDISGYMWANNNRILYLKDTGGDENYKLYGVDIDGSNFSGLTDFENVRTQIIDELSDIDDYIIVGLNKRNPQVFDPYRLNINTGELTMLAENPGNIQDWLTDHEGKLRVALAIADGVNTSLLFRDTEEDEFMPILTTSFKNTMSPLFFTFDNQNLVAISNMGRDKMAAVIYNPYTKEEDEVLYENPDFDLSGVDFSELRKVITGVNYISWKQEHHFFDDNTKTMMNNIEAKLGDVDFELTSSNKAEDKFIVYSYSDKSMGTYFLYDKKEDQLDKIIDVAPDIDANEMASMNPIQYESRDGLTIHGYLTLPKGYTMENAKNLPVVVNPHGGPWYRDSWGFNPEVQFLANKGYAVLQMNFRGSTGYGKKFWEASFKEWGRTMQNDITDGVNWLIDQGIADKSRIAIYGASYGGYATLAGVTLTPDLYAAAVDYVGVSNLFTFMKTIPPYWKPLLDMMHEMVGDPQADSLMMYEVSPVFHADKIKTPLFVAQGANDPRVNINESNQMVEALKQKGVTVEYMVKENEGHGFRNEENSFDFYNAMEKFLDEHLKTGKEEEEMEK
jgi:dipeptidyl aminopeptidase/acylaminoacyl peptidase